MMGGMTQVLNETPTASDGLTDTVRAMRDELAEHFKGADPESISKAVAAIQPGSERPNSWGSRDLASQAVKAYRADIGVQPRRTEPRPPARRTAPVRKPAVPDEPAAGRTEPAPVPAPISAPETEAVRTAEAAPHASAATGSDRFESVVLVVILLVVALAAGAASFTHVKEWTLANSPEGTGEWFGWANAVISELIPIAALLTIRRRRRARQPIGYPMFLLACGVALSLAAQLAVAKPGLSGWLLSAVPALAFMGLSKLVLATAPKAAPAA